MANVGHHYELFWHVGKIIEEWPVLTADTIGRARKTLVDGGYLQLLEEEAPGRPPRYRFMFLGAEPMAIGWQKPDRNEPQDADRNEPQNADRSNRKMPTVGLDDSSLVNTKGITPIGAPPSDEVLFRRFYAVYPEKKAPADARKAFAQALKRAPAERIIAGAKRYRDDPNREPGYTKYPATWLRAGCWDDDPIPPRQHLGLQRQTRTEENNALVDRAVNAVFGGRP